MARNWDRLSALDAYFLGIEDGNSHMHVGAVLIFEGGPLMDEHGALDIQRIRRQFEAKLHLVPRYRQKLAYVPYERWPVWIDDERFNIEYHVRLTALPKPGGPAELKQLSGRIMSQALDRGKPLWEIYCVEGLADGTFAMISKTHHCMIDGIAGTDLMTAIMDLEPDAPEPAVTPWRPRPVPKGASLLVDAALHRLEWPLEAVRAVRSGVRQPRKAVENVAEYLESIGEVLAPGLRGGSKTPINVPIGPHRLFDWVEMDLAEVKAVKNALGGTVNDVVLATVAGALRKFFQHRKTSVDKLDIRALVPVNVRTQEERGQTGNRIATMSAPLPVNVPTAKGRLQAVRRSMGNLKKSRQAVGAQHMAAVAEWTVPNLLVQSVRLTATARAYNLIVTNVPGPQIPLYTQGARLIKSFPLVPIWTNQAVGIALLSYDGKLFWGLNVDWDAVPDVDVLGRSIADSFAEFQELAGTKRRRRPAAEAPAAAAAEAQATPTARKKAAAKRARGGANTDKTKTTSRKKKSGGTARRSEAGAATGRG